MPRYWPLIIAAFLIALTALVTAHAGPLAADPAATASIRAGHHDCPACMLKGADLTNQCVKGGNLTGADFDEAKLVVACMSKANFHDASFRHADLTGANLAESRMDGADLTGAILSITSLKGTDLSHAKGLTQAQLDQACGDGATRLPAGLRVKRCE